MQTEYEEFLYSTIAILGTMCIAELVIITLLLLKLLGGGGDIINKV